MENKKTKKAKTIHMKYPAPYSWSQTGSYERKPSIKKSLSYPKEHEPSKISLNKTPPEQLSKKGHIRNADEPYFIIRPLNKCDTKQLSVSQILHVDIVPRKLKSPERATSSARCHK